MRGHGGTGRRGCFGSGRCTGFGLCKLISGLFAVAEIGGVEQLHVGRGGRFDFGNALVERDGRQTLSFIGAGSNDGFRAALVGGNRNGAVLIHTGNQLDRAGERFTLILCLNGGTGGRIGAVFVVLDKVDRNIALCIDCGVGVRINGDGCAVMQREDVALDLLISFIRHLVGGRHIDVAVVVQLERQLLLLPSFGSLRFGNLGNHKLIEEVADLVGFGELLVRLVGE